MASEQQKQAIPVAPAYTHKADATLCTPLCTALLLLPVPALLNYWWGWLLLTFGSWALFLAGVFWIFQPRQQRHRDSYVAGRTAELVDHGIPEEHASTEASERWERMPTASPALTILTIISMVWFLAVVGVLSFAAWRWLEGLEWSLWASVPAAILHFAVLCMLLVIPALAPFVAINGRVTPYSDLVLSDEPLYQQLAPEDRNDWDIVKIDVTLQTALRRVETYTLESTLLSALAFSAFVGILMAEKVTMESIEWIRATPVRCFDGEVLGRNLALCLPLPDTQFLTEHLESAIALSLLACSVLLLSVLVTRLRFNEAYRYVEEFVGVAKALNAKEESFNTISNERYKIFGRPIAELLEKAESGESDLRRLVNFMRGLRNWGINAFIAAIALCGLYFGTLVSLLILGIFAFAYLYGQYDGIRRSLTWLQPVQRLMQGRKNARKGS